MTSSQKGDPQKENIDTDEIARFSAMAKIWWDRKGEFKALHDINPIRLAYIANRSRLTGKSVLDVGCGGGLLSERLASCGARVTGIDMEKVSLSVAREHMKKSGFSIDYRMTTVESLAKEHSERYDAAVCMELLEHVPEPFSIIDACGRLVRPGGDLFFATVNRTFLSWLLVIGFSEYVAGIVRKGTHTYQKLVKPEELKHWGAKARLQFMDLTGLRYLPFLGYAALCKNTQMNYLMHFKRKE